MRQRDWWPSIGTVVGVLVLLGAAGCQSVVPPDAEPAPPAPPPEFIPASFLARIQHEEGPYASLLTGDSYAIWVGEDVMGLRRAKAAEEDDAVEPELDALADQITDKFLVFECAIGSVFGDMSIAYDAVGFRNISVYLQTADGERIEPMQTVIGTPVREEARGALKYFHRRNYVVFPKYDMWDKHPTVAPGASAVRLVLEGHGTTFYFEWAGALAPVPTGQLTTADRLEALKVGFRDFCKKMVELGQFVQ